MSLEDLTSLMASKRFRTGGGPSWSEYVGALKTLDGVWRDRSYRNTSFGVLGRRPSWEDTIRRAAPLFDVDSWAELDAEQTSMIAPTHFFEDGNLLLGSVGKRSNDVRYFLEDPDAVVDRARALSLLKKARGLSDRSVVLVGADILADLCDIRGMGRSFATRLLTLAKPDGFVVVNNKSADWLRAASGLALAGKERSYRKLLRWLDGQSWRRCTEPVDETERKMWRIRTALLDAFAYQPWV
jgi:hypothetical protein